MDNQEIVGHMVDAWNNDRTDTLDEIYHADAIDHWGPEGLGETHRGLDAIIDAEAKFRAAFPEYRMRSERVVSEGALVAHHWTITGTHEGEFAGIEPTGNEITYDGMAFHRIEDGKIRESWWLTNRLRLLEMIGAVGADD